jgi:hypothetical protein
MSNGKKANKEGRILLQTPELLFKKEKGILDTWMKNQMANITLRPGLISKEDLEKQSKEFLTAFTKAISTGNVEEPRSINRLSRYCKISPVPGLPRVLVPRRLPPSSSPCKILFSSICRRNMQINLRSSTEKR